MLKSQNDIREFRHLQLANGLQMLLVEDPNCQKSACSATVHAGHFNDPQDCQGLSHLLEHMLFSGNQRYPQANAFNTFASPHGGSVNAATGTEYTSYFFDITHEYLSDALGHFLSMLSAPLFLESFIEKEMQAIEAEFRLKQKDDLRRLYQVHKETCNPQHPFSKFSVGNQQIFSQYSLVQLKTMLRAFYQQYYQPDNIRLCLISHLPLASTEKLVSECFSQWPLTHHIRNRDLPDLYLREHLGVKINIVPLHNTQRLIITFALPAQSAFYRAKPLSLLSHIIGDEGKGGLLDYYKEKNWATNLSAGGGIEGANFKDFNINLQLTGDGVHFINEIIQTLFSYINLIRHKGLEAWRFDELRLLNQLNWDFAEIPKPIDEALRLSLNLFEYPVSHVLAGDYLLDQPSVELVIQMIDKFTPQNMRIKLIYPDQLTNKQAH